MSSVFPIRCGGSRLWRSHCGAEAEGHQFYFAIWMGIAIAAAMFLLEVAQEIFRGWKVEFVSLAAIADVDAADESAFVPAKTSSRKSFAAFFSKAENSRFKCCAGILPETRHRTVREYSFTTSLARMPSADSAPGNAGTMTCGMLRASARAQACRPPAPPKATSAKWRGSRPRSMETTRMAFSMVALTTRMTPAANCFQGEWRATAASAILA